MVYHYKKRYAKEEIPMIRYMLLVYGDPTAESRPMEEWMDFHKNMDRARS